ncbi:hypothetical protein LJC72_00810 [Bacteroides sp. OttesenSCG-928-D19]|nr:hypothetical protein [Bacteroides sp. OttesenSCG-928-D19]
MKRLVLVSAAVLLFSATGFAKGGEEASVANYNFDIKVSKLSHYLQLTSAQTSEVADICDFFTEQMKAASYATKNQKAKIDNAVYGNLKLMKKTLTDEQYKKYVKILNVTLQNKGIEL